MWRYMKEYLEIEMFWSVSVTKVKNVHTHIKVICEEENSHAVCLSAEVENEYPVSI
jgi:hypothetical protein